MFNVYYAGEGDASAIEVMDVTGKKVFEGKIINNRTQDIDLSRLQNGFYILYLKAGLSFEKFKIMISK